MNILAPQKSAPRPQEISSRDNSLFKKWKTLLSAKGIKEHGLCLVSGAKIIHDLMTSGKIVTEEGRGAFVVDAEITTGEAGPITNCKSQFHFSQELFRELDEIGDQHHILIVRVPELPQVQIEDLLVDEDDLDLDQLPDQLLDPRKPIVVLPLSDPNNVGAALRSCAAFNLANIILTEEAAHPYLPRTIRASAGASLAIKPFRGPRLKNLLFGLATSQERVCILDMKGESMRTFKWPHNPIIILGEEGRGIPTDLVGVSDEHFHRVTIPIQKMESLNATVALSIALYSMTGAVK